MDEEAQHKYTVTDEKIAVGTESVLYRGKEDGTDVCVKEVRWPIFSSLNLFITRHEKGAKEPFRAKAAHIKNEYGVGRKLREEGDIPIVKIYGLREKKRGLTYGYDLIMELIPGYDLGHKSALRAGFNEKVDWFFQMAVGLKYMHERGYAHLDVKPANAMRMPNGRIILIDFGLSKLLGTTMDSVVGTSGAIPPELLAGKPVWEGTDIFALAVTFNALCHGKILEQGNLLDMAAPKEALKLERTLMPTVARDIHAIPELEELVQQCTIPKRDLRIGATDIVINRLMKIANQRIITLSVGLLERYPVTLFRNLC